MKKILLLSLGTALSVAAIAQKEHNFRASGPSRFVASAASAGLSLPAAKSTAVGDTFTLSHFSAADTITFYYTGNNGDSGFVAGMDAYGDKAFAERYDVNQTDSTIKVIGVIAWFGGKINPASTKSVTFNVWDVAPKAPFGALSHVFYSGLPGTGVLASRTQPITALGIGVPDTAQDSIKGYLFTTPTGYLRSNFFIGYSINYAWNALGGDTIGLHSNQDGERSEVYYTTSGADTVINDVNATMYADGTWHDDAAENFFMFNNLYILPIIKVGANTLDVKGVTRDDFTFYGSYPNPARNSANIHFALTKAADVTVTVMDMNSHIVKTIVKNNVPAGDQLIAVDTDLMPAGEYIYAIRTSAGDGVASTMMVIK